MILVGELGDLFVGGPQFMFQGRYGVFQLGVVLQQFLADVGSQF